MNRCPVTKKYRYDAEEDALYAADVMALHNWQHGQDTEMNAYWCPHCENYHVGTRTSRPIHPWKPPLHEYQFLRSPRPRVTAPMHAGNLFFAEEKNHANRRLDNKPRPRRNRTHRPYPARP